MCPQGQADPSLWGLCTASTMCPPRRDKEREFYLESQPAGPLQASHSSWATSPSQLGTLRCPWPPVPRPTEFSAALHSQAHTWPRLLTAGSAHREGVPRPRAAPSCSCHWRGECTGHRHWLAAPTAQTHPLLAALGFCGSQGWQHPASPRLLLPAWPYQQQSWFPGPCP